MGIFGYFGNFFGFLQSLVCMIYLINEYFLYVKVHRGIITPSSFKLHFLDFYLTFRVNS